ncbi:hypothetical protein GJV26_21735 [Massilia dura]|uniref:Uncharacterized protein n=1 Tax=Pseudoduganella dura TaxID=321982 RepID=A0A6I3XTH0_9BURK|nr:hypothetical protein [Pseudoduganella dura]MUI15065.1 hypothetical protein [Pseudoduganella dura]GGY02056.1 hypothetical protein GCM10007386_36430 [Pseudoduganella dura]
MRLHSAWRYLWPIQSAGQLLSYCILILAVLAIMAAIVPYMEPVPPLFWVSLSAAACASVPLYAVLPARIDITTAMHATAMAALLHRHMAATGYVQTSGDDGIRHYRPVGPRWRRWEESRVSVRVCDESTLRIEGAVLTLKGIEEWLEAARPGTWPSDSRAV